MSLALKYRPTTLSEVRGQDKAVAVLTGKLSEGSLPHTVLLSGPTGTGKTTCARILAREVGCDDTGTYEVNCAEVRGIDSVREIQENMRPRPLLGKAKAWILDEVIQLPSTTQKAFLKVLEEPPSHVYFFLCASDTTGLLSTFIGRCFHVTLSSLDGPSLATILGRIMREEDRDIDGVVLKKILTSADGSARRAIQLLEAALTATTVDDQIAAVNLSAFDEKEKADFLGSAIFRKAAWSEMAACIRAVEKDKIEGVRLGVLTYAAKVLLGGGERARFAYFVIQMFQAPFYMSSQAGLAAACWECHTHKH